jgi:hypothetical protein
VIVLHPNPVEVVHVRALDPAEHEGILTAVGDAAPAVALARTVFAVCVANSASVIDADGNVCVANHVLA